MNTVTKGILLVMLIIYVVSPVDLCPGPVDDILMILLYAAGRRALPSTES